MIDSLTKGTLPLKPLYKPLAGATTQFTRRQRPARHPPVRAASRTWNSLCLSLQRSGTAPTLCARDTGIDAHPSPPQQCWCRSTRSLTSRPPPSSECPFQMPKLHEFQSRAGTPFPFRGAQGGRTVPEGAVQCGSRDRRTRPLRASGAPSLRCGLTCFDLGGGGWWHIDLPGVVLGTWERGRGLGECVPGWHLHLGSICRHSPLHCSPYSSQVCKGNLEPAY